jgi:hypothetical protein
MRRPAGLHPNPLTPTHPSSLRDDTLSINREGKGPAAAGDEDCFIQHKFRSIMFLLVDPFIYVLPRLTPASLRDASPLYK